MYRWGRWIEVRPSCIGKGAVRASTWHYFGRNTGRPPGPTRDRTRPCPVLPVGTARRNAAGVVRKRSGFALAVSGSPVFGAHGCAPS